MKRAFLVAMSVVLLISLLLASVSCGSSEPTATAGPTATSVQKTDTFRIGLLACLSGAAVGWGIPWAQSFEVQRDLINDAGGFTVGDTTYTIELLIEDDAYSAATGVAAVNKLIFQDEVDYIIVGFAGSVLHATAPILNKNEILGFTGSSAASMPEDSTWIYKTSEHNDYRYVAVGGYINETYPDIKTAVAMDYDIDAGHYAIKVFTDFVNENTDWEIAETAYCSEGTKEYYTYLNKLLKHDPDLLFLGGTPGAFSLAVKQVRELGYTGPIFGANGLDTSILIDIVGEDDAYEIYVPYYDPNVSPEVKELCDEYIARYGEYSVLTPFMSDYIPVIIQAAQQAGTLEKHAVKNALDTGTFTSTMGEGMWVGQNTIGINHIFLRDHIIGCFQDGDQVAVGTVEMEDLARMLGEL